MTTESRDNHPNLITNTTTVTPFLPLSNYFYCIIQFILNGPFFLRFKYLSCDISILEEMSLIQLFVFFVNRIITNTIGIIYKMYIE